MKTRKCPGCGKAIPFDAITCKHCGMLQFSSGNDINEDFYEDPRSPQEPPAGMYGQEPQSYAPQDGQGGYPQYGAYNDGYGDGNYDNGYDGGYADDYTDGYADNYADGYAEGYTGDYGYQDYQDYKTEAAEDYAEVNRQIRREQGYVYEEDPDGGYDDFDPDEADAMRRRLLVIVLSVISILLIVLIVILVILRNRASEFEKKQEATRESKTFTNMIPSMTTASSELAETPVEDSSDEEELKGDKKASRDPPAYLDYNNYYDHNNDFGDSHTDSLCNRNSHRDRAACHLRNGNDAHGDRAARYLQACPGYLGDRIGTR